MVNVVMFRLHGDPIVWWVSQFLMYMLRPQPHLEQMDNVPLLVSLFTDCTPDTTKEMVGIMQDYGEVVVCAGSADAVHRANSITPGITECIGRAASADPS